MATTGDFKNGMCMEFKNGLYTIVEFQHVKPGKGPAFVRTKLKNVKTGKVIDNTFTAGEKVHEARVERRQYQYLYNDGESYHFMHTETYDQLPIDKSIINNPDLLKEGEVCEILYHTETETPLVCELPAHIIVEITYTEPGEKGNTASSNVNKPATIESGATVNVPLFINIGDKVKIDTRDNSYVERVKA